MNTISSTTAALHAAQDCAAASSPQAPDAKAKDEPELRKAFDSFVGQTFYGQMLQAMRKTVGKPAYVYGGRAEEIFRQQFDQVVAEKLGTASADKFSGPMYELFALNRK